MRILKLQAENVKKLKVIDITPVGDVIQITGANGSGKSSVLDCIEYALAGKSAVASKPVREGEETARIRLDMGELVVTRKFDKDGRSTLIVESANGAQFKSPQSKLDPLVGPLSFDPLEFSRDDPKAQLDVLRKLVPLTVDIDELDGLNKRDYDARALLNRDAKALKARVDAMPYDGGATELIDESDLLGQMVAATGKNSDRANEVMRRQRLQEEYDSTLRAAEDCDRRALALQDEAIAHRIAAKAMADITAMLPPVPEVIDVEKVRVQIEEARAMNAKVRVGQERHKLLVLHREMVEESDALTAAIAERNTARIEAIAEALMPVPGLGFGDGCVLFNDLPLDQASSAEQLRVSVAIAMAANPTLRILRIKDGSLLDETSLDILAKMATEQHYQVWIECVDTSGKIGIVMEEGEVAADHQSA